VIGGLGERDQILVAACLTGLRSARTRRACQVSLVMRGWMHRYESRVISSCIEQRLFQ
jgi:hypothetical protein